MPGIPMVQMFVFSFLISRGCHRVGLTQGLFRPNVLTSHGDLIIREVWANNLEEEFAILRDIIEDYPLIFMVFFLFSATLCCSQIISRTFSSQVLSLILSAISNPLPIITTRFLFSSHAAIETTMRWN